MRFHGELMSFVLTSSTVMAALTGCGGSKHSDNTDLNNENAALKDQKAQVEGQRDTATKSASDAQEARKNAEAKAAAAAAAKAAAEADRDNAVKAAASLEAANASLVANAAAAKTAQEAAEAAKANALVLKDAAVGAKAAAEADRDNAVKAAASLEAANASLVANAAAAKTALEAAEADKKVAMDAKVAALAERDDLKRAKELAEANATAAQEASQNAAATAKEATAALAKAKTEQERATAAKNAAEADRASAVKAAESAEAAKVAAEAEAKANAAAKEAADKNNAALQKDKEAAEAKAAAADKFSSALQAQLESVTKSQTAIGSVLDAVKASLVVAMPEENDLKKDDWNSRLGDMLSRLRQKGASVDSIALRDALRTAFNLAPDATDAAIEKAQNDLLSQKATLEAEKGDLSKKLENANRNTFAAKYSGIFVTDAADVAPLVGDSCTVMIRLDGINNKLTRAIFCNDGRIETSTQEFSDMTVTNFSGSSKALRTVAVPGKLVSSCTGTQKSELPELGDLYLPLNAPSAAGTASVAFEVKNHEKTLSYNPAGVLDGFNKSSKCADILGNAAAQGLSTNPKVAMAAKLCEIEKQATTCITAPASH